MTPDERKSVFISYATKDRPFVDELASSMSNIGLLPYIAERDEHAGAPLRDKLAEAILGSLHFVSVISPESSGNQWVNQELGFAFGLRFLHENQNNKSLLARRIWINQVTKNLVGAFRPIEIYPLIVKGVDLKGFIDNRSVEYIALDTSNTRTAIKSTLSQIRLRCKSYFNVTFQLELECKKCRNRITSNLPSNEDINNIIAQNKVFAFECAACHNAMLLDPYTFKVL